MEQHFNGSVDQVAGGSIINIYVQLKNRSLEIKDLSLSNLLKTVDYIKQENKLITKKQYLNAPSILIVLISFYLLFQSLGGVIALASGEFRNNSLPQNNLSVFVLLLGLFSILICAKWLHNKTKYLNPIRLENNQIIYDIELEIQKRKLRGKDKA